MSTVETRPLSEKQLATLERFGYDTNTITDDDGRATLDKLKANGWKPLKGGPTPPPQERKELDPNGPATKKQVAKLKEFDYETDGLTFAQASELLDKIAANGWERPADDSDDDL